jgi:hypothetical protein
VTNQQWTWISGSQFVASVEGNRQQADDRPAGRYYASSAFIEQQLILFGGETLTSGFRFHFNDSLNLTTEVSNDLWSYTETATGTTASGATTGASTTAASTTADLTTGMLTTGILTTTGVTSTTGASTTGSACVPISSNCFCTIAPLSSATCNNGTWEVLDDVATESQEIDIQPYSKLSIYGDLVSIGNTSISIASNAELHVYGSMTLSDTDTLSITGKIDVI